MIAIGNGRSRELFDGDFYISPPPDHSRPACNLVFVQSREGNTGAADPSTLGGGATDKHFIYEGLSRVAVDGVLAGAETVRGGDFVFSVWQPEIVRLRQSLGKSRNPAQIIATLRGLDLDRGLIFNTPDLRLFVLTVGRCADVMRHGFRARPWLEPIVMSSAEELPAALTELRRRGIDRISAIGGRRIATQLIDAGLVQDVYLTTSPRSGGEPNTPMYPRPLRGDVIVRKHGTGAEDGIVFEHVRLKADTTA